MIGNKTGCNSGIGILVKGLPDIRSSAKKECILGTVEKVLKYESSNDTEAKIKNFLHENGIATESPHRVLNHLQLDSILGDRSMFIEMINDTRKDELVEGAKHLNSEVTRYYEAVLRGLKVEINRVVHDNYRNVKERLDRQINADIADGLRIGWVINYLNELEPSVQAPLSRLRSQGEELQASIKELEMNISKNSQKAVEDAHSFLIGRAQRMQNAAGNLCNAVRMIVYSMALIESHNEVMKFLEDLTIYCREQRWLYELQLDNFLQVSRKCQESILDNSLQHKDQYSGFEKIIPNKVEIDQIINETIGFNPENPPLDVMVKLAGTLRQGIPSWPSCKADELMAALEDFFNQRLDSLANLDLKRFLTWRAEKRGVAHEPSVIGHELVVGLLQCMDDVWLPHIKAELPNGGVPVIALLEVPGVDLAPFFRQEDLAGIEIHFQGVMPTEIMLIKIKIGIPKEALRMWNRYEDAYNQIAADNVPIIPKVLLLLNTPEIQIQKLGNGATALPVERETGGNGHRADQNDIIAR
jgi:hypothetical protein